MKSFRIAMLAALVIVPLAIFTFGTVLSSSADEQFHSDKVEVDSLINQAAAQINQVETTSNTTADTTNPMNLDKPITQLTDLSEEMKTRMDKIITSFKDMKELMDNESSKLTIEELKSEDSTSKSRFNILVLEYLDNYNQLIFQLDTKIDLLTQIRIVAQNKERMGNIAREIRTIDYTQKLQEVVQKANYAAESARRLSRRINLALN